MIPVKYAGCFIAKEAEETNPKHTGRSGPFTVQGRYSDPTDIQRCVYSCFGLSFKFAGLQVTGLGVETVSFCVCVCVCVCFTVAMLVTNDYVAF